MKNFHSLRSKGKEITISVENFTTIITRKTDNISFITKISPFLWGSYLLSCVVNKAPFARLLDQQAEMKKDDNTSTKYPAVVTIYPGKGSLEGFPFKTVVAFINLQSFQENIALSIPVTAIDAIQLYSKITECYSILRPENYLIAGTIVITTEESNSSNRLYIQVGGSEKVELDEESRKSLISVLRRWLSGLFLEKNPDQEGRNKRAYYNKNGLIFNGTSTPTLACHNIRTPFLSYCDVAELNAVLEILRGTNENLTKEGKSKVE